MPHRPKWWPVLFRPNATNAFDPKTAKLQDNNSIRIRFLNRFQNHSGSESLCDVKQTLRTRTSSMKIQKLSELLWLHIVEDSKAPESAFWNRSRRFIESRTQEHGMLRIETFQLSALITDRRSDLAASIQMISRWLMVISVDRQTIRANERHFEMQPLRAWGISRLLRVKI